MEKKFSILNSAIIIVEFIRLCTAKIQIKSEIQIYKYEIRK